MDKAATPGVRPEPEQPDLRIGYMPLADAAPLLWAQAGGHFARYGLRVSLEREVSWASLRDRLAYGALDAAQCLAPMPLAAHLGIDGVGVPLVSALCLSRGGSSVTLSRQLMDRLHLWGASPLRVAEVLHETASAGERLRFGHVFAWSMHHYLLRDWLASAGEGGDSACDAFEFQVAPPPQMVQLLESGAVDGFCVGEPWNLAALRGGLGAPVVACRTIWGGAPEKVLGVTRAWAEAHPATHRALVAALLAAQRDLARPEQRRAVGEQLAVMACPPLSPERLLEALEGAGVDPPTFRVEEAALRPSQVLWCLLQMLRWRQMRRTIRLTDAVTAAAAVCDVATYRDAARVAGLVPSSTAPRVEGLYEPAEPACGAFLAGPPLDPAEPAAYLRARGFDEARLDAILHG